MLRSFILQNNSAHHRHIISFQFRYSLSQRAPAQKSEERRQQFIIRIYFRKDQIITLLEQWNKIQIKSLRRGCNTKSAICTSRSDRNSNSEMSIFLLIVPLNH